MKTPERWVFIYHRGAHQDNLVHTVISDYGSWSNGDAVIPHPVDGITDCGVRVHEAQGTYVHEGTLVTCIRCMSGVCLDGIRLRQDRLYSRKGAPVIKGYGQIRGYAASQIYIDEIGTPSKKP